MSILTHKIKQFYNNNRLKSRLLIAAFIVTALLVVFRITLPFTVIYSTTSWLAKQGINTHIEDIDFDFINGRMLLKNASGTDKNHHKFNIGNIKLSWRWAPLSDKIIDITGVEIQNMKIDIQRYTDTTIISGINLTELSSTNKNTGKTISKKTSAADNSKIPQWGASIGSISFSNTHLCYQQYAGAFKTSSHKNPQLDYCAKLDKLLWQGKLNYAISKKVSTRQKLPITIRGDFKISGLAILDKRFNRYLIRSKQARISRLAVNGLDNISIDAIHINDLSALQRGDKKHFDTVRLKDAGFDKIKLQHLNKLGINNISLSSPDLFIKKDKKGNWEYKQWLHLPATQNRHTKNRSTPIKNSAITGYSLAVNIAAIRINNSDFCYDDTSTAFYYCLNQNRFDWKGKIHFSTKNNALNLTGDLALDKTSISNRILQRQLLSLNKLVLTQLSINNFNHITVNDIRLENLHALQRSRKMNDDTLWFSNLNINAVRFINTDNLAINTINLTEPGIQVSKNINGNWEFNKWLENINRKPDLKTPSPVIKKYRQKKTDINKKPFIFSINKLAITSDQNMIYRDKSLKPELLVGLKQISLHAENINNARPKQKIQFKLYAKSTRHATIKLAGYILPFRAEPSFNAAGNLLGLDLRAASPAVRKATGHIIESGQMDARLKLLAKNGILHSNINLTLYQFKLKAISQKDATALDKIFGMPVNQSLALLRNKDGDIHLDIPVTGNIDKPDFDPVNAIIKATTKATTFTLITFFTPYGLVYAGSNLLYDLATAVDFKPVLFMPGSTLLSATNRRQLDKLAVMLNKKPQLHLTLCGSSNQADWKKLFPETRDKQADSKTEEQNGIQPTRNTVKIRRNTDRAKRETLIKLATKRQQTIKSYLIDKAKTGADRLILCTPEFNTGKAIAGVNINI